jgi:hypothetical protein
MRYWYMFWIANLFIDGLAFALISLVVIVGGVGDLRQLFLKLREHGPLDDDQPKDLSSPS